MAAIIENLNRIYEQYRFINYQHIYIEKNTEVNHKKKGLRQLENIWLRWDSNEQNITEYDLGPIPF